MSWEEAMLAVFDDLEQQAEGLHLAERDLEVADLALAEYAHVTLAARLHASVGRELRVGLHGGDVVTGRLARVGEDWLLLAAPGAEWVVRHAGVTSIGGLSARADNEEAWSVVDRLSVRVVLRRLAAAGDAVVVHLRDAQQLMGRVRRVGRDFFELGVGDLPDPELRVVPVAAVTALQGRRG